MKTGYWWGRRPPEDATVAWGARAIYHPPDGVDVLPDRQSIKGDGEAKRALVDWINTKAMPLLKERLRAEDLASSEIRVILISHGGYTLEASPNGSYGYLYLGVWPTPTTP